MKPLKAILQFFIGILLLCVALTFLILGTPWGIIEYLIKNFYKKRFWKGLGIFGKLVLSLAAQVDMMGCVIFQVPFNRILINKDGYQFGSIWDTISFVLGMNQLEQTLTPTGKWLCNVLDYFEDNHCIKTAESKMAHLQTIIARRKSPKLINKTVV